MSTFSDKLKIWFSTTSSVIGTAVATPAIAGALLGAVSWHDAALPILGALVAIAMPGKGPAGTPANAEAVATIQQIVTDLARVAGNVSSLAKASAPTGGSFLPPIPAGTAADLAGKMLMGVVSVPVPTKGAE